MNDENKENNGSENNLSDEVDSEIRTGFFEISIAHLHRVS